MKKFISTVLALGMAVSLAACGGSASTAASTESTAASAAEATADSDLAYIKNKGKMTIGYTVYEPMNYTDADGNFTGFDTELATAVCEKLGVEPDFVEINWDTKIVELDAKSIDCIWNGMSIDDERREKLNLSEPYLNNQQVVVVLSDSGINTLADLAGKEVILQAGSTAEGALDSHPEVKETLKDGQAIPVDNNVQAMMELKNGTGDAVIMDAVVARYYLNLEDGDAYKILDEVLSEEEYAIGFRKGDQELRDEVQKILGEMKADGKLAEITIKWFGEDISKVPDNQ